MYIAAVLEIGCQAKLRDAFLSKISLENYEFISASGPLPHHMTINMGEFDETLNPISILEEQVEMMVQGFYFDHLLNVCAAKVTSAKLVSSAEKVNIKNAQPHITLAIRPPGKPFNSNKINWNMTEITNERGHIPTDKIIVFGKVLVC